jgi:exosortase
MLRELRRLWHPSVGLAIALLALVVWCYWSVLSHLAEIWSKEATYSHGYLVPLFALVLLWLRNESIRSTDIFQPSWWALPLVLAAAGLRLIGAFFYYAWLDQISILLAVAAVFVAVGGKAALRWSWPAILFLIFMVPLPGRLANALASPLQRFATLVCANILQTLGFPAQPEGNVIVLSEVDLGVVEACSGLRMLMVFIAVSTAVAALAQGRSPLQRILVGLSSIPIALICNVVRITLTGVLHETAGHEVADFYYHDVLGWFMVPMALALLWLELRLLSGVFLPPEKPSSRMFLGLHTNGSVRTAADKAASASRV